VERVFRRRGSGDPMGGVILMKPYELIQETERRGISLELCPDGRLKVTPLEKAQGLLEDMKKHRSLMIDYAEGRYRLTPESVNAFVASRSSGSVYWATVADLYPQEIIDEAKARMFVVEQLNGFFRLPSEKEYRDYEECNRRRKTA
jgi:hypothetical protein